MSKLFSSSTRQRPDVVFFSPTQIALRKIKQALFELYQNPAFQQQCRLYRLCMVIVLLNIVITFSIVHWGV